MSSEAEKYRQTLKFHRSSEHSLRIPIAPLDVQLVPVQPKPDVRIPFATGIYLHPCGQVVVGELPSARTEELQTFVEVVEREGDG